MTMAPRTGSPRCCVSACGGACCSRPAPPAPCRPRSPPRAGPSPPRRRRGARARARAGAARGRPADHRAVHRCRAHRLGLLPRPRRGRPAADRRAGVGGVGPPRRRRPRAPPRRHGLHGLHGPGRASGRGRARRPRRDRPDRLIHAPTVATRVASGATRASRGPGIPLAQSRCCAMSSTERMLLVALLRMRNLGLVMVTMLAAACAPAKDDDKGVVDDSGPPTIPSEDGKADGSARIVAVDVQSAHPYANNLDKLYTVPLADLPPCAYEIRLHFAMLRTEPGYDFVTVEPAGAPVQSFDGSRDDTWTAWFPTSGSAVNVRLDTDGSVTRHGFAIDKIEWNSLPLPCPNISGYECAAGEV